MLIPGLARSRHGFGRRLDELCHLTGVGDHRDVAGRDLDGSGAHAGGEQALGIRRQRLVGGEPGLLDLSVLGDDRAGARQVDAARMRANLDATGGLLYSSAVLLELVSAGMTREDAYALVQAAAMETWEHGTPFRDTLRKQAAIRGQVLPEQELEAAFQPERYTQRLTPVFERLTRLS